MTDITQADPPSTSLDLQPLLHDLASSVAAPGMLLSALDGQIRPGGVQGWYVADVRLLDTLHLSVDHSALDLVHSEAVGAERQRFSYVARGLGDRIPDPTVRVDRVRVLRDAGFSEDLVVESVAQEPVDVVVHLDVRSDLAPMALVKQGGARPAVPAELLPHGLRWRADDVALEISSAPAPEVSSDRLTWRLRLDRGERRRIRVEAHTDVRGPFSAGRPAAWRASVEAADIRVTRTAAQSLADLEGLLMADGVDRFLGAGSPWFLTLFGRDSLWAARMLVPLDADLALSTLRVLASRQGTRTDPSTEEEPGKILHEVRAAELDLGDQVLPPVYYGTVDATPLFVVTLADAWDWGADTEAVRDLLPAVRRCLEWIVARTADTGWLRYVDHTGQGLVNQGWKDSHDSIQFANGRLAEPPIALSEVQAYAYEAAVRGAAVLAAYGEPEVPGLRSWSDMAPARFMDDFWVGTVEHGHPAVALDRDGLQADSLSSNIGHLLGTGLLGVPAAARVADLLADPRLDSGFGLRTLSSDSPRFSRLSYHGGTVWPHDTAIAVRGLSAEGRREEAARLARGLFVAAEGVSYRLPELYGGDDARDVELPSAYPAACRPQAWSAAAPIASLVALSGVRVDARARVLRHPATTSSTLGPYTLRGLRAGDTHFDVRVAADGSVGVELGPDSGWTVAVSD